jgi:CRISPR/Cas system endoribonuclease Cas6 (RAMP superfamily)
MMPLPVARYQFVFDVQTPLHLNFYSGSMLRGVFGHSLRHLACMTKLAECRTCPLYRTCPYPDVFETPPPEQHGLQTFSQIPPPYVIEPPPIGQKLYRAGEELRFSMVLIGRAIPHLPLIIFAWQRAFARGVTKSESRATLRHVIFEPNQPQQHIVFDTQENDALQEPPPSTPLPQYPISATQQTLIIKTPLRIQQKGRVLANEMQGRDFLIALVRRYYLLQELHGHAYIAPDFAQLSALAKEIHCQTAFSWCQWDRYSNRQQQKMTMGGVLGRITLTGELTPFLPLLHLGQWLHVGNKTTFGMGQYDIL